MKKMRFLGVFFFLFFLLPSFLYAKMQLVDKVVGIVNGEIITLYDLNLQMQPVLQKLKGKKVSGQEKQAFFAMQKKVLNEMIVAKLIEQEAKRLKMKVSVTEVENYIRQIKESNGLTEEKLQAQLRSQGLNTKTFREKIRQDILRHQILQYMVQRKVAVTDEDIENYYQKHQQEFFLPKEIVFQLVLLPTQSEAEMLFQSVQAGETDFTDFAQKHSEGLETDKDGNIGPVDLNKLDASLRQHLENLKAGEVGEPFVFAGQYAVAKCVRIEVKDAASHEIVREKIREILFKKLGEKRFDEFLQELRSKAVIETLL